MDTINGQTPRQLFTSNYERLKQERLETLAHCREINRLFMPRTGRFFEDRPNSRPGRRNDGIYDNTATRGVRTTAASLQSTTSSPARPWFRLRLANNGGFGSASANNFELDEGTRWLDAVRNKILDTFQGSNVYQSLHQIYLELVLYGTAVAIMVEDKDSIMRLQTLTFGEYCLDMAPDGKPNALYRELRMTTSQLVKKFGIDKCSPAVAAEFRNNQLNNWHDVLHVIEPRDRYDPTKEDPENRAWRSTYMELAVGDDDKGYAGLLSDGGYDRFPVLAVRWDVQGADVYGTSPAMDCLGDVQSLQQAQFRMHQAFDYKTKPPMGLPSAMRGSEINMQPGGKTFVTGTTPAQPLWQVQLQLNEAIEVIRDIQARIHSSLFVDVFLSLLNANDTTQRTAEEIRERRDEKFQLLGPVVDRLSDECHEPLITWAFYMLQTAGMLPPLPDGLDSATVRIEFISVLAQAQKAIQTVSTDRIIGTVMAVGQQKAEIWDKIDVYALVDHLTDRYGGDPSIIVGTDKAMAVAEARNRLNAAKEQALMAEQMAGAAKDVGSVPTQAPLTGAAAADLFSGGAGDVGL